MLTTTTTRPLPSCRSCGPSGFDHPGGTPHRLGCVECAHNFGDHLNGGSGRCALCPCEGRPPVSVVRTVTTGAVSTVTREPVPASPTAAEWAAVAEEDATRGPTLRESASRVAAATRSFEKKRARRVRPVKLGGEGRPRVNDAGERACDG